MQVGRSMPQATFMRNFYSALNRAGVRMPRADVSEVAVAALEAGGSKRSRAWRSISKCLNPRSPSYENRRLLKDMDIWKLILDDPNIEIMPVNPRQRPRSINIYPRMRRRNDAREAERLRRAFPQYARNI